MRKLKRKKSEICFDIVNYIGLSLFTFTCIYPFYYIFLYSISDSSAASKGIIWLYPLGFSLNSYIKLFESVNIIGPMFISASRAVVGTAFTIFCSSFLAYLLTQRKLLFRKAIYRLTVITMYLSAGLIPWYMTMRFLGLRDNYLLYILPTGVVAFYVILIKTYIEQLPAGLEESARIDGAGVFTVYVKIIFPICLTIIACVAVFSAVGQWNAWQDNFYLVNNPKLRTLQLVLLSYINDVASHSLSASFSEGMNKANRVTPMSIQMTITMVATLPILLVYPFLQKYFVKGIMLGAIKG